MLRVTLASVAVLALVAVTLVHADDQKSQKSKNEKKATKATVTKVDAKHHTVTVRMKDKSGKEVTRTFKPAEDIEYLDSTGRVADIDIFRSGDEVLVLEREGHLKWVKKTGKSGKGKEL